MDTTYSRNWQGFICGSSSIHQQHKLTNKQPADVLKPGLQWDMDQIHNTYKTFLTTKWWGAGRMETITHDINSISLIKVLFDSINKDRQSSCYHFSLKNNIKMDLCKVRVLYRGLIIKFIFWNKIKKQHSFVSYCFSTQFIFTNLRHIFTQ